MPPWLKKGWEIEVDQNPSCKSKEKVKMEWSTKMLKMKKEPDLESDKPPEADPKVINVPWVDRKSEERNKQQSWPKYGEPRAKE